MLSTHVLDAVRGIPAGGLTVVLIGQDGDELEISATDAEGRIRFDATLVAGAYGLYFDTGPWFAAAGRDTIYPAVTISFSVDAGREHLHVPLLLSPYSYTTYRGS